MMIQHVLEHNKTVRNELKPIMDSISELIINNITIQLEIEMNNKTCILCCFRSNITK